MYSEKSFSTFTDKAISIVVKSISMFCTLMIHFFHRPELLLKGGNHFDQFKKDLFQDF